MADERAGTRESDYRKSQSWMRLFGTFLVALDPFKLLVAAFGVLATSIGWWLLSVVFWGAWSDPKDTDTPQESARREMMREYAGDGGRMRVMPWSENRGPNPFTLGKKFVSPSAEEREQTAAWFVNYQVPNLIEPLRKFLSPIVGLFDSRGNIWTRVYLFLALMWLLMVWAFAGGVITRMAVLQLAGKEGGGLRESVRFVSSRYLSYLFSPLVPIAIILAVVIGCIIFGLVHMLPFLGDVFDGVFWWIPIGAGFVIALLLVGLVGYPLMYTTLSTEGSDTFDALSRSYNYVYESPWSYLWYSFVAIVYGAVVVFFVVFMGSLMVYLGKWGVGQTPWSESAKASPEYLMIYTPKSFGWREILVEGSPVAIDRAGNYVDKPAADEYMGTYRWWHHAAAGMVSFWITLVFMLMLGFSYSYFWTAASMIYLLMRKKVDETETDEVYIEDEEPEEPVPAPKLSATAPSGPTQMVEAPSLRVASTPATQTTPPAPPAPAPTTSTSVETPSAPSTPSATSAAQDAAPTSKTDDSAKPSSGDSSAKS